MRADKWLIEARKARHMSMRDLARAAGLTHTTIMNAERGEASFETWKKLAEYFGEPVENVLTWAGFLSPKDIDPEGERIIRNMEKLDSSDRDSVKALIQHLASRKKKRRRALQGM